jgi:hypothetical protein
LDEVERWIERIPIFRAHLASQQRFREAAVSFELWTTGTFAADAVTFLEAQKKNRTKTPIDWRDGSQIAEMARKGKEQTILEALNQHFLKHP